MSRPFEVLADELGALERAWHALSRSGGSRRLSSRRTHKASSAESILRHCLRRTRLSLPYRRGELTGRQALELLEAVRQYAREWLRHEAEQLIGYHGRTVDADGIGSGQSVGLAGSAGEGRMEAGGLVLDGRCSGPGGDDPLCSGGGVSRFFSAAMRHHVGRFFGRVRQFISEAIYAGIAALRGPGDLTVEELALADHEAEEQGRFLAGFVAELAANPPRELADPDRPSPVGAGVPMSPARIAARAEQYGNAAHQAAQRVARKAIGRPGGPPGGRGIGPPRWERRVLGRPMTEHCTDCPPLAAQGWVPLGTLPAIGESECDGMCLCHFEYTYDEVPPAKTRRPRPRPRGERPPEAHPEGPLSPEQLEAIIAGMSWSATMVVGA